MSLVVPLIGLALTLPSLGLPPLARAQDAAPSDAPPTSPAEPAPSEPGGIDVEPVDAPSAFCGVLTPAEASEALGVTLKVGSSSDTDCSWDADFVTSDVSLIVARDAGDFELDAQEIFPDGSLVEVAGKRAWYTPEGFALFVDLGDDMLLTVELFGTPPEGTDLREALTDLAALVLPRLDAIPVPTEVPEPSSLGDPVLQSLIPPAVGDAEMVVDVYTARDLMADLDPDDPDAASSVRDLEEVLAAHGKSIDDVSFANAYFATETTYGDLFAIRIAGADVAAFQDELVDMVLQPQDPRRTPATIAGHQVTVVTDGPPADSSPDPSADPDEAVPPSYVYPVRDVLFIVSADEPQLTQLFKLLP